MQLRRNNRDASVCDGNFHALSRGESRVLQPVATQAPIRYLGRSWPSAIELIVVAGAGASQRAGPNPAIPQCKLLRVTLQ